MVKKSISKINYVIAILSVLFLLFSFPKVFVGHAIAADKIPDVSGEWAMTSMVTFENPNCQSESYLRADVIYSSIFIDQIGESLTAKSSEFQNPSGSMTFAATPVNLGFISEKKLYSSASYQSDRGDKFTENFTDLTLSEDCNSMVGSFNIVGQGVSRDCEGTGEATLKRKNPTGCGIKCVENWTCSDWGNCNNGTQIRLCADKNSCKESTRPSESRSCQLPAIVPEKTTSPWIYAIVVLAILIMAAGTMLLMAKLKKKKSNPVEELQGAIDKINSAMDGGDKMEATSQYKLFLEKFTEYKSIIGEEDYGRLYNDVLKAYNRILQSNTQNSF